MRLSWLGALASVFVLWAPGAAMADAAMDRLIAALDEHGTVMQADQASQLIRTFKLPTSPNHLAMKEVAQPDKEVNQRRFAIVRRKKGSEQATIIFTWADAAQGWFLLSDRSGRLIQAIYSRAGGSGRMVSADDAIARRAFEEQRSFWTGWAGTRMAGRPGKGDGARRMKAPVPRPKPASMQPAPAQKGDSEKPEAPGPQKSEKDAPLTDQTEENGGTAPQPDGQRRPRAPDGNNSFWEQDD